MGEYERGYAHGVADERSRADRACLSAKARAEAAEQKLTQAQTRHESILEDCARLSKRAEAAEETVRGHELMKWPDEAHRLQQQRNAAIRRAEAAEAIIDDIRRIVTEWKEWEV